MPKPVQKKPVAKKSAAPPPKPQQKPKIPSPVVAPNKTRLRTDTPAPRPQGETHQRLADAIPVREVAMVPVAKVEHGIVPVSELKRMTTAYLVWMRDRLTGLTIPSQLATVFEEVQQLKKLVEDYEKLGRARMLELVTTSGTKATEKGTLRCEKDGWVFEARPHKTGLDGKLVEALLRAKGRPVSAYMEQTISYKLKEDTGEKLLADKVLTPDELKTCEVKVTMVVQPPKKVSAGTSYTEEE